MDVVVENDRCVVGPVKSDLVGRISTVSRKLEGSRRWRADRCFSFERTPFNLQLWAQAFPTALIRPLGASGPSEPIGEFKASPAVTVPLAPEDAIGDQTRGLSKGSRPPFSFRTAPRAHQASALGKIGDLRATGLFMDIGCGKTWTAINIIARRWCEGLADYAFIVAPNGVHEQWVEEQIPKHMPLAIPYKAIVLGGDTKRKESEYKELLAFEGLKILCVNIDRLITVRGEERILRYLGAAGGRCTMIIDESHLIKNATAKRTKAAFRYGALCSHRMILSGTPVSKSLEDLWSQFKFLDEAIIGHRYLTTFRNQYCIMRDTPFGRIVVGHQNVEDLYNKIDPYVFRITSDEALDLPESNYKEVQFNLSDEQLDVIRELRQNFFADFGSNEKAMVKNAATLLTRIQQISCGYLPTDDGGVKVFKNPRLEALLSVLEQTSKKVIIWARFHHDIVEIKKALGDKAVTYYGLNDKEERSKAKRLFLEADSVRYFIASPAAAGTGLDGLQHISNFNVYYSNSFNGIDRWQSEGRTRRDGTKHSVTYIDLVARKSPDAKIIKNLKEKKDIGHLTLDAYRELLS